SGAALVIAVVRDVTRRHALQSALRDSEERYRTLAEAAPVGVFRTDHDGLVNYVNERWVEIAGMPAHRAFGDGWLDAIHPEDRPEAAAAWHTARGCIDPFECECRLLHADGSVRWVLGRAVRTDGGRDGFVGTFTDLTQHRETEQRLHERDRRFRAIVDQEFQSVGLLTTDGIVLEANASALSSIGARPEDVIGKPFWETPWWSEDQHAQLREAIRSAASGEFVRFETHHRGPAGRTVVVDFSLKPVRGLDNRVAYLLPEGRDMSEAIEVRERLRGLAEQLARSNAELRRSNQDLDDFAYVASHDLKEPLRGIANYAAFLAEDYGERLDDDGRRMLATTQRLCERMGTMLDSLLEYSRVGRTRAAFVPTDLDAVVGEVVESLRPMIDEQRVRVEIAGPLGRVVCDAVRIGEVFQNLLVNAIKYNDGPDKLVEIGRVPESAIPTFFVRDNGIGIDAAHFGVIFGMFRRLHGREAYGGGTGAGLSITRKIIERHGGEIRVESALGGGSTFTFSLPENPPGTRPEGDADAAAHDPADRR
ncbi:MAG: PAS domain S-box protein, partial [Planctomycetes bacterium]|nr:PAS domain S-box protein [Planctomycetota bacterium]